MPRSDRPERAMRGTHLGTVRSRGNAPALVHVGATMSERTLTRPATTGTHPSSRSVRHVERPVHSTGARSSDLASLHESVDRALAQVSWRVRCARRVSLPAGTAIHTSPQGAFVYVLDGRIAWPACASQLDGGDVLVSCGGTLLTAENDAVAVIAELEVVGQKSALPRTMAVRGFDRREPTIATLAAELGCPGDRERTQRPADRIICAHIATTVLSAALRTWARDDDAALAWHADTQRDAVSHAIDAMHREPAAPWTVSGLAARATMGRSAFAARFREVTGTTPLKYLAGIRIADAQQLLREGNTTIADIATRLGYESADGFTRAFRRAVGITPSQWRSTIDLAA